MIKKTSHIQIYTYFFLLLCSLCVLTSCTENEKREKVYLEDAKLYMLEKDWRAAISQLQNFIAIENEASVEDRAEAWFLMAEVRLILNQLKESYEVLEYMLDEPDYNMQVRAEIYKRLIALYDRANLFSKSAQARINYALYTELPEEKRARLLVEAAVSYQSIMRYEDSLLVLEDAYAYAKNTVFEAYVYYYQAQAQSMLDMQEGAIESLKKAIKILELLENDDKYIELEKGESYTNSHDDIEKSSNLIVTESLEGIDSNEKIEPIKVGLEEEQENQKLERQLREIKGFTYFFLADLEEVSGDIKSAYTHFKVALDYYPNRSFIQRRIDILEEKYAKELNLST